MHIRSTQQPQPLKKRSEDTTRMAFGLRARCMTSPSYYDIIINDAHHPSPYYVSRDSENNDESKVLKRIIQVRPRSLRKGREETPTYQYDLGLITIKSEYKFVVGGLIVIAFGFLIYNETLASDSRSFRKAITRHISAYYVNRWNRS